MNDRTLDMMLDAWAKHQANKPDAPPEYLVEVPHLQKRMNEWQDADTAWRLIIGVNMANQALDERMSHEA